MSSCIGFFLLGLQCLIVEDFNVKYVCVLGMPAMALLERGDENPLGMAPLQMFWSNRYASQISLITQCGCSHFWHQNAGGDYC